MRRLRSLGDRRPLDWKPNIGRRPRPRPRCSICKQGPRPGRTRRYRCSICNRLVCGDCCERIDRTQGQRNVWCLRGPEVECWEPGAPAQCRCFTRIHSGETVVFLDKAKRHTTPETCPRWK